MNRELPPQQSRTDLVDEFWNLQNDTESLREDKPDRQSLSDSVEAESIAIAEALSRDQQKLGSTEYGRFLALYYSLLQNSRMTFLEFVNAKFIPLHVRSKAPAGQRHYRAILKHILRPDTVDRMFGSEPGVNYRRLACAPDWPYLNDVRLCDLKPDYVRNILSAALARGYSIQTVKHIRNVIGTIITQAAKRRCFSGDNPAFQVPLPRMVRKQEGNLTADKAKHLLGVMKPPDRDIALSAIFTGLNMLELCGLQWKSVNLTDFPCAAEGTIIPPRSIAVRKQLNGGKLIDVRSNRIRNVDITGVLIDMLKQVSQRQLYTGFDNFVFVTRAGTPHWPANLQLRLKHLGCDLGMPWLSWHLFTKAHKTLLPELADMTITL